MSILIKTMLTQIHKRLTMFLVSDDGETNKGKEKMTKEKQAEKTEKEKKAEKAEKEKKAETTETAETAEKEQADFEFYGRRCVIICLTKESRGMERTGVNLGKLANCTQNLTDQPISSAKRRIDPRSNTNQPSRNRKLQKVLLRMQTHNPAEDRFASIPSLAILGHDTRADLHFLS